MFLKNYTSEVPVSQTIYRIEQVLIKCGVTGITKEYGPDQSITAIRFHIPSPNGELSVRLPVNVERALEALWLDYVDGDQLSKDGQRIDSWGSRKKRTKNTFRDQAARTAWRITQDWVEVQMSMIQMKQAETLEVFLPYVWDGKETVYTKIVNSGYRALLPEKTE